MAPFFIRVVNQTLLFVVLEDAVDGAANHGDGTTVDRVDGIADEHVDYGKTHTPDEASPDAGLCNTTPVETQHEGSQECTSQSAPGDTHQLSDERRRIEGDEQGDGNEEHDEHTHHHHLTTLDLLGHDIVDGTILHLASLPQ